MSKEHFFGGHLAPVHSASADCADIKYVARPMTTAPAIKATFFMFASVVVMQSDYTNRFLLFH
jgi:hypothetical protein